MKVLRGWLSTFGARLAVGYVLVVALLAGAWAWSLFGPFTSAVFEQQRESLEWAAHAGAYALATGLSAQDVADGLTEDTDLRMTIVADDGTVLADSEEDPMTMENHRQRPEIQAALEGDTGSDMRLSATQGVEQLYVAVPGKRDGQTVAVRVSRPMERIASLVRRTRTTGLLLLGAALVTSTFIAFRISSATAGPVQRLASAARAIAAGDMHVPVPRESGELGVLSDALENLAEEVRDRVAELESERHDLETVLNGLSDAVFLVEDGVVRLANRAAAEMFGAPFGGWSGAPLEESVLPASLVGQVRERMEEPGAQTWDCGPDPRQRFLHATLLPLSSEGRPGRRLLVVSDITERRRLDDVRRDFVANASHELKTPTAGIHLLAESAQAALGDGDEEDAADFVAKIREESSRMRRLVEDLLDLSRLEALPADSALTDVRTAVDLSMTGHRPAAAERGLALGADLSQVDGEDVFVVADHTDVAVALDNVLDNAIAYTQSGSVRISVTADDEWVTIEVTDTGMGIPPEDQDRVFERFYRVDPARSRATGGTGLGLSLVRHAVLRSGGEISLDSTFGVGTTVALRFPRAS